MNQDEYELLKKFEGYINEQESNGNYIPKEVRDYINIELKVEKDFETFFEEEDEE